LEEKEGPARQISSSKTACCPNFKHAGQGYRNYANIRPIPEQWLHPLPVVIQVAQEKYMRM